MRRLLGVILCALLGLSAVQAQTYRPSFGPGFRTGFLFLQSSPCPNNSLAFYDYVADTGCSAGVQAANSTASLTVTQAASAYDLAATKLFPPNTPRRTSAGLLIEAAGANAADYSQDFSNAFWTKDSVTVSPTGWAAPDGSGTGNRVTMTAGDQYNARIRLGANSIGSSGTQTWSMFYRPGGAARYIHFRLGMANFANFVALFDTQTNTYLGAGYYDGTTQGTAPASASVVPAGNGAYRLIFTVVNTGTGQYGGVPLIDFSKSATTSETVWAGTEYADVWGLQCEDGKTTVSSYMPAGASSATRAADAASQPVPTGTGHVDLPYSDGSLATFAASPGPYAIQADPANTTLKSLRAY